MSDWTPSTEFMAIAVAIGHHFWDVENDYEAYLCGRQAANDVTEALRQFFEEES